MGRVGVGVTVWLGIELKVEFWAVIVFFLLVILEAHVGQTKFSSSHALSQTLVQNCGKGGS